MAVSGTSFHRAEGICLRVVDYSETSQVLRFYSKESGKISCIAKGAKRKKSTFRGAFNFLGVYRLVRVEKMSGSLDLVTQAELIEDFHDLAADFDRFSVASYIAEFLDTFTLDGQVVGRLYEIALEAFHRLRGDCPLPDLLFSFESQGLKALGFFPRLRECGACRKKIVSPEAYFSPRDGGAICLRCRPRDQKRFLVRRAVLESLVHFGAGEMPKEPVKERLVDGLRELLDTVVTYLTRLDGDSPLDLTIKHMADVQLLKSATDDLKAFYLEAVIGEREPPSSGQLGDWFWGTAAGALIKGLRERSLDHADANRRLASWWLVPDGWSDTDHVARMRQVTSRWVDSESGTNSQ